jgi:mannosylglycoprotein endo-beta-mannosidase
MAMKYPSQLLVSCLIILFGFYNANAQSSYELNSGWKCARIDSVKDSGVKISVAGFNTSNWMPATVPGTVLTTLLNNKKVPDPFYGMNNEQIPDIYKMGRDYYTYWFVKDFKEKATRAEQVYVNLRGVNYSCDIYLNGKKLNKTIQEGMFLRYSYNITADLDKNGNNRLAILVHPPDFPGNPNGGQGGDGTIAKGVGLQYTAGWDWIQPIRDRNTGIWDKVTIQKTGTIRIADSHIITLVPGVRVPEGVQRPAIIKVTAQLSNPTNTVVSGILKYEMDGKTVSKSVVLHPNCDQQVSLDDLSLQNPKLWWPNGYGPQNLYNLSVQFLINGNVSDQQNLKIGVRQLQSEWNVHTMSRQILLNGQKIFIKGGNWIISDAMLRLSDMRYDAEVRFHRDMNLNLIRVWGGAMIERPEFYDACDKYGLLVFQDLWGSGDCNGRWQDPQKLDDQWTRRKYPDNHKLFLESVKDQVKMVRNHASLAIWCGGNEITPPGDILSALKDTIMPQLDSTRWFVDYSNSDSMSYNTLLGNGDGPYGIQPLSVFWQHQTYPFNSEVGSIGVSDIEALKRFIPADHLNAPQYDESTHKTKTDEVWNYHKYIGYDTSINKYGQAKSAEDFAFKAQLVNYDQYRGLMEGFSSHMWDWYTGTIIWKTQNPWTAMRGQMYDYYLDPNACLYGLHNGSEPLHIMYNPVNGVVMAVNNTFKLHASMMLAVKTYSMTGQETLLTQVFADIGPTLAKKYLSIKEEVDKLAAKEGVFLDLELLDADKKPISQNIYWIPDSKNNYSGLQKMEQAKLTTTARYLQPGKVEVTFTNDKQNVPAFFNRVSITDSETKTRLLPVFYSDNYITVLPGEQKKIIIDCDQFKGKKVMVSINGWNTALRYINIEN